MSNYSRFVLAHPREWISEAMRIAFEGVSRSLRRRDWKKSAVGCKRLFISLSESRPWIDHGRSGRAHRAAGRFEQAEAALSAGISKYPNSISLQIEYAEVAMSLKRWRQAIASWQAATQTWKGETHIFARMCEALRQAGDLAAAEELLCRALAENPDHEALLIQRALLLIELGRPSATRSTIDELLANTDVRATTYSCLMSIVEAIDKLAGTTAPTAAQVRATFATALFGASKSTTTGPPRIAYIASSPMPSSAANCVHVMKMCAAMAACGHHIRLFFERSTVFLWRRAFLAQFGVPDELEYTAVSGARVIPLALADHARDWGATHVYTRSLNAAYFAALGGLPTVLELHVPISGANAALARDLFRLPSFCGLTVITHALHRQVTAAFPEVRDRTYVAPDGADPAPEIVAPFELRRVASADLEVGYVGQLYQGKGIELIAQLAERLPAINFHVVGGEGERLSYWKERCRELSNLVFYGHRVHAEIAGFLKEVDLVVAPFQRFVMARGDHHDIAQWMSPLKIFEYMASGKAMVCSALPVISEVVEDGRNALLRESDNVEAWIQAITLLRDDPDLRARLGATAMDDLLKNFTWKRRARRVLTLLLEPREERTPGDVRHA
jgi:glycosyltransferase involved in cell wall biosynthesis